MRSYLYLFLFVSFQVIAETEHEVRLQALDTAREEELFKWRTENSFKKLPSDEYVAQHTKVWLKFNEDYLKIHKEACATDKAKCLDAKQEAAFRSKVKVQTDLLEAKNNWAKQGKTKDEIIKAEEAFYKALPESDQKLVSGFLLADAKPEKKPETAKPVPEIKPEATTDAPAVTNPEVGPTAAIEVNEDEKQPRNYKAESCKWVTDLPRKIVNGPACGPKSRSRICTGYVICEQKVGGGKFIRMSTCGPDKCGDEDAVKCTKDPGYFSYKPSGETKEFMSLKLKKILSGSSEQ